MPRRASIAAISDMTTQPLSDSELTEIADLTARATPGPWYVRQLDDEHAMSFVAVSTGPDTGLGERWPDFDHTTMVAATLVQQPRYVGIADERWDVNAAFIATARTAVPRLLAEITRLRNLLDDRPGHDWWPAMTGTRTTAVSPTAQLA